MFVQKILRAWQKASLNVRIALLFLTITVLSSTIVGLTSYRLSADVIEQSSIDETRNATKAVAVTVDSFLRAADQILIGLYANKDIAEALKPGGISGDDVYRSKLAVQSAVFGARQMNSAVQYINIFGVNGFSYIETYYHDSKNRSFEESVAYYSQYGLTDDRRTALWVPNQKTVIVNTNRQTITLVRYLRDMYSLEIRGIMIMGLSESSLSRQYQSVRSDVYIIEQDGTVVSHYNKQLLGEAIPYSEVAEAISNSKSPDTLSFYDEENRRLFASYSAISETGWYVLSVTDHFSVFASSYNLRNYIILILLVTIIVSGIILIIVSRALTASTQRLFTMINQVMAGDLSARFRVSGKDAVNDIGQYLNEMLDDIEESIRYRERSERSARLSDIKLLQSQINPHLLYNSLDSVVYHLERGKHESAASILKAMSSFFKLSLSQGDFLIPIEKEIELIKNYLDIQRMCRGKDIELVITGDTGSMPSINVPKMTLQPVVENSILHGFEGDTINGSIKIDIRDPGDRAVISVEDNGSGIMDDETMRINAVIEAPHSRMNQKHYGLWNINQRIKGEFGDESGIRIESEFGVFTRVVITLSRNCDPMMMPSEEGEENV